jgi:hypothetical protein
VPFGGEMKVHHCCDVGWWREERRRRCCDEVGGWCVRKPEPLYDTFVDTTTFTTTRIVLCANEHFNIP